MQQSDVRYFLGLVTFIDILGFRNMVESEQASSIFGKIQHLQRFTSSQDLYGYDQPTAAVPFLKSISFSDSIVRVRAFGSEPSIETILLEIRDLVIAQCELARQGVLIRGGMAAGGIFISDADNIAFGPAFVQAYELESRVAIYPRIIIDDELSAIANKIIERELDHRGCGEDCDGDFQFEEWFSLCSSDDDRHMFINYLNGWAIYLDEEADWGEMLESHRELVRSRLVDPIIRSNPRVLEKIEWLKVYHNTVIEECIKAGGAGAFSVDGDPVDYAFYLRRFLL